MKPILFEFDAFIVPAWHTFYVLGAIAAFYSLVALRNKLYPEIERKYLANLFIACYFGGYFGARLFSIFNDQKIFHPVEIFLELLKLGPMTFYGGFIGAFLFGIIYTIKAKLPLKQLIDLGVPASLVGLAIGRVGCFLNGDDYGIPYISTEPQLPWWVVTFPNHTDLIPRYPVQLFSTISIFTLLIVIVVLAKKITQKLGAGNLGFLSIMGYSIIRFFIEYYRGDPRGWIIESSLSTSQFISILALIVSCFALWILNTPSNRENGHQTQPNPRQ